MATINKVNNNATQAVQRYMEVRMTASGVGAISASNPGNATGDMTSNPFPSVYYYENITGYKSGAMEKEQSLPGVVFPKEIFHIDPSLIKPSTLSFQSERMQNVGQYERNQTATGEDNATMEGDA